MSEAQVPPALSAIVIAHRDEDRIERVVRAVVTQTCPQPFEVIVVTSGRDRTADIVRAGFPSVKVIDLGARALPGAARNAGLFAARGRYVSFPGSHVELPPGSLAARIRAHDRGHAMVTGTTLCGTRTPAGWAAYFLDHYRALPGRPSSSLEKPPGSCSYLREALLAIGGFRPDVRVGEDTIANGRLYSLGYSAYRASDVVIVHRSPCTTTRALVRHHFERGRGFARIVLAGDDPTQQGLDGLGLRGYLLARLWRTTRDVARWGGPLRTRYPATFPLVALGATAAWLGIWYEAAHRMRAGRRSEHARRWQFARATQRVMLRTERGPLRPVWAAAYELSARAVATYLRRDAPSSTFYVRGSMGERDVVYGLSDIDMIAVTPSEPGAPGTRRDTLRSRWHVLRRRVWPIGILMDVAVYEDEDALDALSSTTLLHALPDDADGVGRSAYFGPDRRPDEAGLLERAPVGGPARDWRRVSGPERQLPPAVLDRQEQRILAWGQLQRWWAYAAQACTHPEHLEAPLLCLKLIVEPLRTWMWLMHGEVPSTRAAALARAMVLVPEEREAVAAAIGLRKALPGGEPPLGVALGALLRLTTRIAEQLELEAAPAGSTSVRLRWGEGELALGPDATAGVQSLLGARRPTILPLVDWRALVIAPADPDETFAPLAGSPADPAMIARAARVQGTYPALLTEHLMVLPAVDLWGRAMGRSVQCPLTDPVSFALVHERESALYPSLPGWSARDTARRAVAEHRGLLAETAGIGVDGARADGARVGGARAIALHFSAARAALLLESLRAGEPELALSVGAIAAQLAERLPAERATIEAAEHAYRAARRAEARDIDAGLTRALRAAVLELDAYRRPREVAVT